MVLDSTEPLIVITDPATDRYHTLGYVSWWNQEIVRDAHIVVVGAGALGNEVLKNLALIGVGRILILDFDTIEIANLSRSLLFRPKDNGKSKAEAAALAVRELNPDVKTDFVQGDLNYDLGLGILRRTNVIIGCLDNRQARRSLNQFSWYLDKPWIDGAIQELQGRARVFQPHHGACYECTLTRRDEELLQLRQSCQWLARDYVLEGKVPTTPTIASIIGGIETQEALKVLHGLALDPGVEMVFNGLTNEVYNTTLPIKPDCPAHQSFGPIVELREVCASTTTFAALLAIVRNTLGAQAILDWSLRGLEFVTALSCTNHQCPEFGVQTALFTPLHRLTESDGKCPHCGLIRQPYSTHIVQGDEPFVNHTLAEGGVPAFDIIPARVGLTFHFFELTGDKDLFFK